MNPSTLVPAYGRDYKTPFETVKDFSEGKDFLIADISNRWDGKPCSIRDLEKGTIKIRFAKLRKFVMVKLNDAGECTFNMAEGV